MKPRRLTVFLGRHDARWKAHQRRERTARERRVAIYRKLARWRWRFKHTRSRKTRHAVVRIRAVMIGRYWYDRNGRRIFDQVRASRDLAFIDATKHARWHVRRARKELRRSELELEALARRWTR